MYDLIQWCNSNNGFLTAILSVIGLLLSVIAIIVAIRTARMPYKKKLLLGSSLLIGASTAQGLMSSPIAVGVEASATNVGNRVISVTYIGYAIKKDGKFSKIYPTDREFDCKAVLSPSEYKGVQFSTDEIIKAFGHLESNTQLFIHASDSEGKEYKRKVGTTGRFIRNL